MLLGCGVIPVLPVLVIPLWGCGCGVGVVVENCIVDASIFWFL